MARVKEEIGLLLRAQALRRERMNELIALSL